MKEERFEKVVRWYFHKGVIEEFSLLSDIKPLKEEDKYSPVILFREWLLCLLFIFLIPFLLLLTPILLKRKVYYRRIK